jgi:hypothetical protein
MSLLSLFNKKEIPDPDQEVIDQLKKAGSNLSKEHAIDFFLYFLNPEDAQKAELLIKGKYPESVTNVNISASGSDVLCQVNIRMVPEFSKLQSVRLFFTNIARELNGMYDGWGCGIEN